MPRMLRLEDIPDEECNEIDALANGMLKECGELLHTRLLVKYRDRPYIAFYAVTKLIALLELMHVQSMNTPEIRMEYAALKSEIQQGQLAIEAAAAETVN